MWLDLAVAVIAFMAALWVAAWVFERWFRNYPRIDQPGGDE